MDEEMVLEQLESTCADIKKIVQEDFSKRAKQEREDRKWQVMTILLPVVATTMLGYFTAKWNASTEVRIQAVETKMQVALASTEEFNKRRMDHFQDLDALAVGLVKAIEDLDSGGPTGASLNAAVDALGKFKDPLSLLYFNTDFEKQVSDIVDLVGKSKYLYGDNAPDISDSLMTQVQALDQLMLNKLGTK
jgi:hypothetical protein